MGDLLPCPFCGQPPSIEMTGFHLNGRTIYCAADDCMGPHTTAANLEDATVQWNKRADADKIERLRAERVELRAEMYGEVASRDAKIERLTAALTDMFALMDEGWLLRNTANDAESSWAMRQLGFVQRLAKAHAALNIHKQGGE